MNEKLIDILLDINIPIMHGDDVVGVHKMTHNVAEIIATELTSKLNMELKNYEE